MKKKCLLLTLLLAFCFALPVAADQAQGHNQHCVCGATHSGIGDHTTAEQITWTPWEQTGTLPTEAGNFYLTDNVTLDTNGWEVSNSICLCLNGHTIKGEVQVTTTGALTITDCQDTGKLIRFKKSESGKSEVTVQGTFQFYNGTITENGRGVVVENGGMFNMYGGSITKNGIDSEIGAGVQVGSNCTFRMYGGTISENSGRYGGGVCVSNGGTFEMYGGAIQNNTVTELGGGVYLAGTFHLKGSGTITGNKKGTGDDATENNVYLATGKTITVTGDLSDDSEIKVTSEVKEQGTRIYTGATDVSGISMDDGTTISKYGYLKIKDCTEGEHTPIEDETVCVVCEKPLNYRIEEKYFSELSAAVQSVEAKDTITLLRNVELSGCEVTKDVTLDLNGHELKSTSETAALTIGRNVNEQRAARLTVKNSVDDKGWLCNVVFNGGILAVDGNVAFLSFENQVANKHIIDFIAEGYAIFTEKEKLVKANVDSLTEGGYTVGEHTCDFAENDGICDCGRACPHKHLSGNYCTACYKFLEAETEGTYYKTLSEAVEAVKADGTIDLLGHCYLKAELTINKRFTIHSRGDCIMPGGINDCQIYGTITVKSGTLTLQEVGSVTTLNVKKGGCCAIEGTTAFGTLNVENGNKSLIALPNGYIFVDQNSGEYKKIEEGVEKYENIKVAKCVHTVPNERGKCNQCDLKVEAKIGSTYYTSLSDAMNAAKSGETVTVLTNVQDATYESEESIKLDLVETIITDLTIKAGQVCIEGKGTVRKLTVNNSNDNAVALLYGGTYEEISSANDLENLIPEGYGYYQNTQNNVNTKTWYDQNSTNIPTQNLSVAKLPIVSVAIEGEESVDYDNSITLRTAACYEGHPAENDIRYEWYVYTDSSPVGTKCELNFGPQGLPVKPGTAKVKLTVTVDGYSRSAEKDITVNKMDAEYTDLDIWENLVYNGEARALLRREVFTNADGCVVYYRLSGETNWTTAFSAIKATDAKTYTVEWYLKGTDLYADNGSTEKPNTVTVTIAPAEVIISGGGSITKTYDGTTEIDAASLKSLEESYVIRTSTGTKLDYSTDYTMTAASDSPNAGVNVYYTATFTLTNPNYVFDSSYNGTNYQKVSDTEANYQTRGGIEQAEFPENDKRGEITIINDREATYTLENISSYLPTLPNGCNWGEVKFGYVDYENGEDCLLPFESATVENGTLIFNALRDYDAKTECKLGYLKIKVLTDNYEDGFVYVDVYAENKPEAKVTVTILRDMIYGESLGKFDGYTVTAVDKVSGAEVEGTFHWQVSTIVPTAGKFTAVWHFDPKDDYTYKRTDGSETITVQKATPDIKVTPVTEAGKTLADVVVSVTHRGGEVEGTLRWQTDTESNLPADTVISANTTYYCVFIPADTANYESVSAETVLYAVSTPATRFNVTTPETVTGGSVSVPTEKVKEGSTVTITVTPEAGYVIDKVTVKTKWSVVEVTDNGDGSFSFTQPAGSVTVTPTFKKVDETPETPTTPTEKREWKDNFSDVTSENWFYEAVKYVYESGLMNGRTETSFMPEATATREQFISVLWRMAGSPAATVTATFTDLLEGEYYIPAISWAVEKGIANGYDDGRFGVGDPITREQLATMLYRYEKSIGGGFVGAWAYQMKFTDVANVSEWAWEAICWCNMKKIVNGRDDGSLDPQGYANRAEMAKIFTAYQQLER